MRRLGLTQRVEVVEEYGERRDCLDQEWVSLLERWGYVPVPLSNAVEAVGPYLDTFDLDGIVLTSGNDLSGLDNPTNPAPERDRFERGALEWALASNLPVLGVCRGLELVNDYFGGSLTNVSDHVATEHPVSFSTSSLTVPGLSTQLQLPNCVRTNSYHNYAISRDTLADDLRPVGTTSDGTIECLCHRKRQVVGIMWHPERETPSTDLDRQLFHALFGDANNE